MLKRRTKKEMRAHLLSHIKIGNNGCWNWTKMLNRWGYAITGYHGKSMRANRVSMHIFRGFNLRSSLFVCHHCDNPACINPDHLFIGTNLDNRADQKRKRRTVFGEKNARAKLTVNNAMEVMEKAKTPSDFKYYANKFGVTYTAIARIVQGKNWKYLKEFSI